MCVFELILLDYSWLHLSSHSILLFLSLVHTRTVCSYILPKPLPFPHFLSSWHISLLTLACISTHTYIHTQPNKDYTDWQTQTNHLRELTWSGFILLSSASKLIFAEGLTDITELHLTYQDVIPMVFTQFVCACGCVCVCVCITEWYVLLVCIALCSYGRGEVGLGVREARLPAHVCIYSSWMLQAGSQHLLEDAVFAFMSLMNWTALQCFTRAHAHAHTHTHTHTHTLSHHTNTSLHTDPLSFVSSGVLKNCNRLHSPLICWSDHGADSAAAPSLRSSI